MLILADDNDIEVYTVTDFSLHDKVSSGPRLAAFRLGLDRESTATMLHLPADEKKELTGPGSNCSVLRTSAAAGCRDSARYHWRARQDWGLGEAGGPCLIRRVMQPGSH